MAIFYGNDKITKLLDWLYIGGIENNVFRTLQYVDVWINFAHSSKKEEKIHLKNSNNTLYYPLRFDDGDLYKGQENWLKAYEIINRHHGKKVLISCTEGVSRSAVMALWLLCEEFEDYKEAITHLKNKRQVHIDKNFNEFLCFLQENYNKNST